MVFCCWGREKRERDVEEEGQRLLFGVLEVVGIDREGHFKKTLLVLSLPLRSFFSCPPSAIPNAPGGFLTTPEVEATKRLMLCCEAMKRSKNKARKKKKSRFFFENESWKASTLSFSPSKFSVDGGGGKKSRESRWRSLFLPLLLPEPPLLSPPTFSTFPTSDR